MCVRERERGREGGREGAIHVLLIHGIFIHVLLIHSIFVVAFILFFFFFIYVQYTYSGFVTKLTSSAVTRL